MSSAGRILIHQINPQSSIAEQYRDIRTNIQFSKAQTELKSLIITSATKEEGKSTTVANMAVSFAELGKKVLLIDADLRRPTVHFTFEMNNLKGFSNILVERVIDWKFIMKSQIKNLSILTSGPIPPNPAKLLDSTFLEYCFNEFSERYDLILIDCPPILAVSDTKLLLNSASASVLVIDIEKAERKVVLKADAILKNSKATYLGVVINNLNKEMSDYSDYNYYSNYMDDNE